ncbi:MAG TPA: rod shape-determining protein MreC [Bacteroidota bacterium]|nr:rod shape-determining protein MreC [Bacteroidota bacterium]
MQKFYHIVFQFKEYVVFATLVLVSIVLLLLNDNTQVRELRAIAIGTVGSIQQTFSFIPDIANVRWENEKLRRTNIALSAEVNELREARLENIRLRSMIALKETTSYHYTAGKVVAKNLNLLRNTLTLHIGETDGVRTGNPVVTGDGLVGKVIAVSGHYSIVQSMMNIDFRVSGKVQRSRVDGIVGWNGKSLVLKNVVKSMDVKPGDAIVTSEYSSAYPPGVKIGVVSVVTETPGSLFHTIEITPSVDFVQLEEVFAIDFIADIEKTTIEAKLPH